MKSLACAPLRLVKLPTYVRHRDVDVDLCLRQIEAAAKLPANSIKPIRTVDELETRPIG